MFAVFLIIMSHGALGVASTGAPSHEAQFPRELSLCCGPSGQCHISPSSSPQLSPQETENQDARLCIVCWVDGHREQVVCHLKARPPQLHTGRLVILTLQLSQPQLDADAGTSHPVAASMCSGRQGDKNVIACPLPQGSMNSTVSLMVSVTADGRSALSPAMLFIPLHLVKPEPPANLWYNMTTEGELKLSWTGQESGANPVSYEIRYSSNISFNSWEYVDEVRTQPVSLSGLSSGVTYTVQVRCKTLGRPAVLSDWSKALYIYLHDVTYLPETTFAGPGMNVTVYCIFNNRSLSARNAVWWLNAQDRVPEGQYSVVNDRVSRVTLQNTMPQRRQGFNMLQCCQRSGKTSFCSYRYASLYATGISVTISCETNGDLSAMTCRWNTSSWVKFFYRRRNLPCAVTEEDVGVSLAEECPIEGRGLKSCTLQPILPLACYTMWQEFGMEAGPVKSLPVYVTPMDFVKPNPPFDVEAITVPEGYMTISWERPELPVYDLQFEVRYAVDQPETPWKVFRSERNQTAMIPLSDPCAVYVVNVRCKRLNGPGFWSEWSDPHYSTVQNTRAPEWGPDFWRVLQDNHGRNETNVTLLFAPLARKEPLYCIEGFEVQHQTTGSAVWNKRLGLISTYTFPWSEEVHTVTAVAFNTLGPSTRNTKMTLRRGTNKLRAVSSFTAVVINGSCASLSWRLLPNSSTPLSYVIEWSGQAAEVGRGSLGQGVRWVRVSGSSRTCYLNDEFFASEEYQFVLHPIFANGEGEPVYTKEDRGRPSAPHAAYSLLLIVAFLPVLLFLSVAFSQHRMMKLVWKDIPNPNNCSWAQGMDFKKAEAFENLFRHPEQLTSCPLLLESETISQAVIVERTGLERVEGLGQIPQGSVGPSPLSSSGQSGITYATLLPLAEPGLLHGQQASISSSSDEGNFSADASDLSGSYPEALWEQEPLSHHPHHSYNSTEESSDTSDQEDQSLDGTSSGGSLYYLRVTSQKVGGEEEEEEGEGDREGEGEGLLREATLERPLESSPLLGHQGLKSHTVGERSGKGVPLYMPQFQTTSNQKDANFEP